MIALALLVAVGQLGLGPAAGAPPATAAGAPSCCTIPAETGILIELTEPVGSKHGKAGQQFGIRLAEPIIVDGRTLVPPGVTGVGEVVHAARAGSKPGELILAARYIQYGATRIPLHRTRFSQTGRATGGMIIGPNMAIFTQLGDNIELSAGTKLPVYVAAPVVIPIPAD